MVYNLLTLLSKVVASFTKRLCKKKSDMLMFLTKLLTVLFVSFGLSACAERFGKKSQYIVIKTDPPDAIVNFDNQFVGKTPVGLFIPIKRTYKEIQEQELLLKENLITIDEFNDFKNSVHRVTIVKDDFNTVNFFIQPTLMSKHAPNRSLCILDIAYSLPLLFMPFTADLVNNACNGYQKIYDITLKSKDESGSFSTGSLFGNFGSSIQE
ncbi:MAG: hypothetical protein JJW01_01150 [Alphaproteobacteria bacterium]|nr:hypothetical protein [Rickettsiales bacterium]